MTHFFAFFKLFGDAALYLALGGGVLRLFTPLSELALAAPAVGLGALVADALEDRPKLRWLGLLPAIAALALCRCFADVLAVLPPVLYLAVCLCRRALQPGPSELYYHFTPWAIAAVVGGLLCVALNMPWGFLCGVLGLMSRIFLMRMVRHDTMDQRDRRLVAVELGVLTALSLLCLALASEQAMAVALAALKVLYKLILLPALMLVLGAVFVVLKIIDWLLRLLPLREGEVVMPELSGQTGAFMEELMEETAEQAGNPWLALLVRILGVLAFLAAGAVLFRFMLRSAGRGGQERRTEDTRQGLAPAGAGEDRSGTLFFWDRSPEAGVRRAFAAYCRTVDRRRTALSPDDTARSVNRLAALEKDPAARSLRELYLRARYTGHSGLTREDAKAAAALSKELRAKLEDLQEK